MTQTIVVGVDGSDAARAALEHALGLARERDAGVHAVAVVESDASPMTFGLTEVTELNDAAERLVDDLLEAYRTDRVDLTGAVRRGRSHEQLLDYATGVDADLLVVGRNSGDGLERTLLGSTADRLVRLSDIPVTVVPAE